MTRLADVVGQARAIGLLRDALASGRLHHALLFSGPAGIGKKTTATAFAAWLLCEAGDDDACGACSACVQVSAESHPDYHVVRLERDPRTDKPRRDVSIDQVRDLQAALGHRAARGGRTVIVVDDADRLSEPAQNAFLKTLEEPPGSALVVLVAHNAAALLSTVRSRCQRIPFVPLAVPLLEEILRTRHDRPPEEARLLAQVSAGSLGTALGLDPGAVREAIARVVGSLERLADGRYTSAVEAARMLTELEEQPPGGLTLLVALLRARLRRAAGLEPGDELTPPGKTGSLDDALDALEAASRTVVELRRNANRNLAIERMFLEIGRHGRGA